MGKTFTYRHTWAVKKKKNISNKREFYHLRQGDSFCRRLFVCEQLYISYERILMKFSGSIGGGPRRNRLDFESYW